MIQSVVGQTHTHRAVGPDATVTLLAFKLAYDEYHEGDAVTVDAEGGAITFRAGAPELVAV